MTAVWFFDCLAKNTHTWVYDTDGHLFRIYGLGFVTRPAHDEVFITEILINGKPELIGEHSLSSMPVSDEDSLTFSTAQPNSRISMSFRNDSERDVRIAMRVMASVL